MCVCVCLSVCLSVWLFVSGCGLWCLFVCVLVLPLAVHRLAASRMCLRERACSRCWRGSVASAVNRVQNFLAPFSPRARKEGVITAIVPVPRNAYCIISEPVWVPNFALWGGGGRNAQALQILCQELPTEERSDDRRVALVSDVRITVYYCFFRPHHSHLLPGHVVVVARPVGGNRKIFGSF